MLLNYAASIRLSRVQSFFHRVRLEQRKSLASHAANSYTAAFRSAARLNSATGLKQFPYMELLDSNVAEKDYCVRSIFQEWREARSMLILKARSMRADGPH